MVSRQFACSHTNWQVRLLQPQTSSAQNLCLDVPHRRMAGALSGRTCNRSMSYPLQDPLDKDLTGRRLAHLTSSTSSSSSQASRGAKNGSRYTLRVRQHQAYRIGATSSTSSTLQSARTISNFKDLCGNARFLFLSYLKTHRNWPMPHRLFDDQA